MTVFYPETGDIFYVNLPPVVRGTLSAKYSRMEGSMRAAYQKLIDEGKLEKDADGFYRRVLDTYGDDSVSELGSGTVAVENISRALVLFLEMRRMGSYSEKSSRYAEIMEIRPNGELGYVNPLPSHFKPEYAGIYSGYHAAVTGLFKAYTHVREETAQRLRRTVERRDGESKTAFDSAVTAASFDAARNLLPLCYKTNVAISANGAYYERQLKHLAALGNSAWNEAWTVGKGIREALKYEMNALVRRVDEDAYSADHIDFLTAEYTSMQPQKTNVMNEPWECEPYPLATLDTCAGLRTMHKGTRFDSLLSLVKHYSDLPNRRILPGREFEKSLLTFHCETTIGCFADMQRHRITSPQMIRYFDISGFSSEVDGTDHIHSFEFMDMYHKLVEIDPWFGLYVLPMGTLIRWTWTMNLREFFHIAALRTGTQGHPEYRTFVQRMVDQVEAVCPPLVPLFKFVNRTENVPLPRREYETRLDRKGARES